MENKMGTQRAGCSGAPWRHAWRRAVASIACVAMVGTVCAPALAAADAGQEAGGEARTVFCGLEEHVHTDACYDSDGTFLCEVEEHTHTEDCYTAPSTGNSADTSGQNSPPPRRGPPGEPGTNPGKPAG